MEEVTAQAAIEYGKKVAQDCYDRGFFEGVMYSVAITVAGVVAGKFFLGSNNQGTTK